LAVAVLVELEAQELVEQAVIIHNLLLLLLAVGVVGLFLALNLVLAIR
jgi:hypothetical protein